MKIAIFGANGKTGQHLITQAIADGNFITAYVRRANSIQLNHDNLSVVEGNLNELDKLTDVIKGTDVCISVLGSNSLRKHGIEVMAGIQQIISIMQKQNVKRFLYLSSIGVGDSRYYMKQPIRFIIADLFLRVPLADHNRNEMEIRNSKLDWTILRPGGLSDGNMTDKIVSGSEKIILKGNPTISRASVASFILKQVNDESSFYKSIWLHE